MDSDTPSTARGLLMLRLSLILTTSRTVMVTDLDTPDTTSASRLYQDLSVNHRLNLGQKWIVISLKFRVSISLGLSLRLSESHSGQKSNSNGFHHPDPPS